MAEIWERPALEPLGAKSAAETYQAVGFALSMWELYELELFRLFAVLLGLDPESREAVDAYSKDNRITRERLDGLCRAIDRWSIRAQSQDLEGELNQRVCEAKLLSARRHDIAHGVVKQFGLTLNFLNAQEDYGQTYYLVPAGYESRHLDRLSDQPVYAYTAQNISRIAEIFTDQTPLITSLINRILR